MLRGWIAWYTRDRVYTSRDTSVEDLPPTGVIRIDEYEHKEWKPNHPYRRSLDGGDWYWWDGQRWQKIPSTSWDGYEDKPEGVPDELIKRGDAVSDEEYKRTILKAEAMRWR